MAWSGGKDSALALHRVFQHDRYELKGLLTTLHGVHHRISMHGVREELLDLQAERIGLPLRKVYVEEGTNEEYERKMEEALRGFMDEGIEHVVFGDIFLEDLRHYREEQLQRVGMKGVFPIWREDTMDLLREAYDAGIRTVLCTCRDGTIDPERLGCTLNPEIWEAFPEGVDPCGEYGEFHSFVTRAPYFTAPIEVVSGQRVERHFPDPEGKGSIVFHYIDLLPQDP
jgi:uncharacterized protein (TIGR00290 family)